MRKKVLHLWLKNASRFFLVSEMSSGSILVDRSDEGWAQLTFNRPEKLNTLSIELRRDLHAVVQALEQDPDVHVIILTGAGKVFTAGLDLDEWNSSNEPAAAAFIHDAVASLRQFSGPVIAAVQGAAITGGIEIALACDVIVASSEAKFADTHVHVGLLPGWGGSVRLVERLGLQRAKELALTGRFFTAMEALEWGFVNHMVEPDQLLPFCRSLARQMLKAEPAHMKAYKALLDSQADILLGESLRYESAKAKTHNGLSSLEEIKARLQIYLQS